MIIKHEKEKPRCKYKPQRKNEGPPRTLSTRDPKASLLPARARLSPHITSECPVRHSGTGHSVGDGVTKGRRTWEGSGPKDKPADLPEAGRSSPPATLRRARHDGTSERPGRPEGAELDPHRAPTWGSRTGKPKLVPKNFVRLFKTREGLRTTAHGPNLAHGLVL